MVEPFFVQATQHLLQSPKYPCNQTDLSPPCSARDEDRSVSFCELRLFIFLPGTANPPANPEYNPPIHCTAGRKTPYFLRQFFFCHFHSVKSLYMKHAEYQPPVAMCNSPVSLLFSIALRTSVSPLMYHFSTFRHNTICHFGTFANCANAAHYAIITKRKIQIRRHYYAFDFAAPH